VKVLFLDMDGVLNNRRAMWRAKFYGEHPEGKMGQVFTVDPLLVAKLRAVVEELDLKIVVSSTWRHHMRYVFGALAWAGWDKPPIIGRTTTDYGKRGEQIAAWLLQNDVEAYAILDDDEYDIHQKDRLVKPARRYRWNPERKGRTRRQRRHPSKTWQRKLFAQFPGITDQDMVRLRQLFTTRETAK
jgi:hypothetical protein